MLDQQPAGVGQIRRLSAASKRPSSSPKQRPRSLLRLSDVAKSNDSGYGTSSSPAAAATSKTSIDTSPLQVQNSPNDERTTTPTPFRVDIWDSASQIPPPHPHSDAESRIGSSEILQRRRRASQAAMETKKPPLTERNSSQDEISWWHKPHHLVGPNTTDLSTAAQIVFGESARPSSQNSMRPKQRGNMIDLDGMPFEESNRPSSSSAQQETTTTIASPPSSRRQTIHLPLPPTRPLISDHQTPAIGSAHHFGPFSNAEPGIFDDMALLLSSTIPSASNTARNTDLDELSSWWELNSDLTGMLSQAGTTLKQDEHPQQQQPSNASTKTHPPSVAAAANGVVAKDAEFNTIFPDAGSESSSNHTVIPSSSTPTGRLTPIPPLLPPRATIPTTAMTAPTTITGNSFSSSSARRESPPNPHKLKRPAVVEQFYW